ncbi:beta-glucosidase [Actinomycetota bacterium]|nr:beta-glucosidase [Actinomycetota bacterium]
MTELSSPDVSTSVPEVDRAHLDPSLPVDERVELLLAQMTLEEKAGLFFHTMVRMGPNGSIATADPTLGVADVREHIGHRHMNHFNLLTVAQDPADMVRWHNTIQEIAASTRLGIPVTISSDPRHSQSDNDLASLTAGAFSLWPETLGLAALRDEDLVRRFGEIVRDEYTSVGIRVALHPQVDLATEPRWCRQLQTFGEDTVLSARLGAAFIRGLQGDELGPGSVAAMTKHFPGGGPQMGGEDAHFAYGREQVYPGGRFDLHLIPFEAAFEAGTSQIMPYYGMPVGTEHEEVGFGFNKSVITGLLREKYGFDGIVCTDWGLLTDAEAFGEPFPARAWGVEHLTTPERMLKAIEAGVDQFGGEAIPDVLVELVRSGLVHQDRLDQSARRLLREKFRLGLFDNPPLDVARAVATVGKPEYVAAGDRVQRVSVTLLKNAEIDGSAVLPIGSGRRLYVEGIDPELAGRYGRLVEDPADADLAILRIQAPWEPRDTAFANLFHSGSLDFPAEQVEHIRSVAAEVPTVLDVFLDRPAVLTPFIEEVAAVVGHWGSTASAVLDVLTGAAAPEGALPFELPRSMSAVEASREDVPFDTEDPLFPFGYGLRYSEPG